MPSRARKKPATQTRKRRKKFSLPKWSLATWLWLAVVINTSAGLWFSAATAPKRVQVNVNSSEDIERFSKVWQDYHKTPWLRLNRHLIASRMQRSGHIDTVEVTSNVFGRGTMQVSYKRAIAKLDSETPVGLTSFGDLAPMSTPEGTRSMTVDPVFAEFNGCITGTWPARGVGELVDLVKDVLAEWDFSLDIDSRTDISLRLENGPRVRFGLATDLPAKVDALRRLMEQNPRDFQRAKEVNVSVPEKVTMSA
ncbi:MAG: hypothetical protein KDC26_05735 [Armatimonadetes bacterium]|nr:hypothetical protein [Armatimonadota bacterium]